MTVWIVEGWTGEYSDRASWPVRGFWEEAEADTFAARLNAWCEQNGATGEHVDYLNFDKKPPEDPHFRIDYTGSGYRVYSVEVEPQNALSEKQMEGTK